MITKKITYKKQGDGVDSWIIQEFENEILSNSYIVYENPEISKKEIDLISIMKNASEEELIYIAKKLSEKL